MLRRWYTRSIVIRTGRISTMAAGCCVAFLLGGCSIALPIASLMPDDEPTGSITSRQPSQKALKVLPSLVLRLDQEDERRAKGALGIALDPLGNGSAVAWDNPQTGVKGSITPLGQPYLDGDEVCRSFQTFVQSSKEAVSQNRTGIACRPSGGDWTLRTVSDNNAVAAQMKEGQKAAAMPAKRL